MLKKVEEASIKVHKEEVKKHELVEIVQKKKEEEKKEERKVEEVHPS